MRAFQGQFVSEMSNHQSFDTAAVRCLAKITVVQQILPFPVCFSIQLISMREFLMSSTQPLVPIPF